MLKAVFIVLVMVSLNEALTRERLTDELVQRFSIALKDTPFAWSDCGNGTLPLQFSKFSLTPSPIPVPGKAKLSFDVKLARDVKAPVKAELIIEKKMFIGWKEMPCELGLGSCTYNDICPFLDKVECDKSKPDDKTCHCPFKKGTYTLAPTDISIDDKLVPFPWILVRGQYKIHAKLSDNEGQVSCLFAQFTLV